MAKDGTVRGGLRPGAGRKKKDLSANVVENPIQVMPDFKLKDMEGVEMPPVHEYMLAKQRNGKPLMAPQILAEITAYIRKCGCEDIINPLLVEQYAMATARWIQCENAISEFGMLAKHPTTGSPCASPYVAMGQQYLKQANQSWYQIYVILKENAGNRSLGESDPMEKLLLGG